MVLKWVLIILATMALLGAVVGVAASVSVGGVDNLGSGSAVVLAPDPAVAVTDVEWGLNSNNVCGDNSKVAKVTVSFAAVNPITVYDSISLVLKDGSGTVLRQKTDLNVELNSGVGGYSIVWSLSGTGGCISASEIEEFAITVVQAVP